MSNTSIESNKFEEFKFPQLVLEQTLYTLAQLKNAAPNAVHIALAGRSNVGKSSLINALARRRQLAKVSATPGKTRSVNLYKVEPHGFYLTDLPGYGYAKRSKAEREIWANLIEKYLIECENLAAVAILLDCRLEPQDTDKMMVQFALAHQIPIIPVLTKADKCSQKERSERISQWTVLIPRGEPLAVSSQTGMGLEKLWKKLIAIAENSAFARLPAEEKQEEKTPLYEAAKISIEVLSEKTVEEKEQNGGQAEAAEQTEPNERAEQAENPALAVNPALEAQKPKKIRTKRGAAAREREAQKKTELEKARLKAKEEKSRAKHKKKGA